MTSSSGFRSTHDHGPVSCCAVAWTQGFVPAGQAIYHLSYIFSPFFCFTDRGTLCSSGWPHTHDLLASVSPVLGLQIWCIVPNYKMLPSALTLSFVLITKECWRGCCLSSKNSRPPEYWTVQCHRARAPIPSLHRTLLIPFMSPCSLSTSARSVVPALRDSGHTICQANMYGDIKNETTIKDFLVLEGR